MADQFLHGVDLIEIQDGIRPIRTVKSSVIGIVGTAPKADESAFPLNKPVLIRGSRKEAAKLGTEGTLLNGINGILDQIGALIVVIRVEEEKEDTGEKFPNLMGLTETTTKDYLGIKSLLSSESALGLIPKILVAPGFTDKEKVVSKMLEVAKRLRAIVIADGPNTTDEEAITYRDRFTSDRLYIVDPAAKVLKAGSEIEFHEVMSPRVAGLIARSDNERGFWCSPSNQEIHGITGTTREIDFSLSDPDARANRLNEKEVATVIRKTGFRLWGNRTCSDKEAWAFLSVRRTADMINESLLRTHLWAVDRNISKTYIEDVAEGVNAYLRDLRSLGAILGGRCWADADRNRPSDVAEGKVYFNFDFTPPYPAEHIVFRSILVNNYLEEIL